MRRARHWTPLGATLTGLLLWTVTSATQAGPPPGSARPTQPTARPAATVTPAAGQGDGIRFTTLPGFTIERAVPAGKTDSYVSMTFDSQGRLVVSKEVDHPRRLIDADKDGVFEGEQVISDKVRNCQGLWFDGPVLYGACAPAEATAPQGTNSGPRSGLYRMADTNGDGVADTVDTLATFVGGIQEHGPHAIRRGPDGEMTMMIGNNTFLADESQMDPASPFRIWRESQFLPVMQDGRGFGPSTKEGAHGTVHRVNRATNTFSIQAGALRNAYDHAFNLAGEMFTFDSDMEWDINMPWYRDVRTVHMIPGGDNGYRNGSGKFPPYYQDALPPVRDLGRGSPVGVEFYQAHAYPAAFRDVLLEADWSRGRLLYTALTPAGATYSARTDRAELVHGEPLNITDVEVGPDGLIYFTIGGRLTEGGLFRVRYTGAAPKAPTGILAVARQAQPLSSWGWAALESAKQSMGAGWQTGLETLARDAAAAPADRAQAVYLLQRHGPAPSLALLTTLVADKASDVRAAAVYVAGVQGVAAKAIAVAALADSHPMVQRRAAEALVRMGQAPDQPSLAPVADLYALLNSRDRYTRFAGRLALHRTARAGWKDRVLAETNLLGLLDGVVAYIFTSPGGADLDPVFDRLLAVMKRTDVSVVDQQRLLRAFQLAAIEAKGLSPDRRRQVHDLLIGRFPTADAWLNRELASVLAFCGQPAAIGKILATIPEGDAKQPQTIHYLSALRHIKEGWTSQQKAQVMDVYARVAMWRGGASFPGFINLLFDGTLAFFSDEEKKMAYGKVPQFAPLTAEELGAAASATARLRARSPANARARGIRTISREEIVEEQIFTPQRTAPSASAGAAVYEKACAQCHRFGSVGTEFGPDLTTLRSRFKKKDVLEAILWPSRTVSDQYDSVEVEKTDGDVVFGIVVREDGQKIVVQRNQVERPVEIPKALVKARRKSPVSLMPEGLVDDLSQQELANLLAFMLSTPQ